jgi:hypothetical protein
MYVFKVKKRESDHWGYHKLKRTHTIVGVDTMNRQTTTSQMKKDCLRSVMA